MSMILRPLGGTKAGWRCHVSFSPIHILNAPTDTSPVVHPHDRRSAIGTPWRGPMHARIRPGSWEACRARMWSDVCARVIHASSWFAGGEWEDECDVPVCARARVCVCVCPWSLCTMPKKHPTPHAIFCHALRQKDRVTLGQHYCS